MRRLTIVFIVLLLATAAYGELIPPRVTQRVEPKWPAEARAASALVVLEAIVTKEGTVREVRVVKGDPRFNKAAVESLRQWKFAPATDSGKPVSTKFTMTFSFRHR
jgi:protein TonB